MSQPPQENDPRATANGADPEGGAEGTPAENTSAENTSAESVSAEKAPAGDAPDLGASRQESAEQEDAYEQPQHDVPRDQDAVAAAAASGSDDHQSSEEKSGQEEIGDSGFGGANRGLVLGLLIGGGVLVLAMIVVLVLFLTGVFGGGKISSAEEMRESVREYAEEKGLEHCSDLEDTVLGASSGLPEGLQTEVCSNVDLTSMEALTQMQETPELLMGMWSDEKSGTEELRDQLKDAPADLWARHGEQWVVVGRNIPSDGAEKAFGGEEI